MTIEQILNLDCRQTGSKDIIQNHLKKIKPLSKYNGLGTIVPVEKLEKAIKVLVKKYNMSVRLIGLDCFSNNDNVIWQAFVYNDVDLSYYSVYGLSTYELLAKTVIYMYSLREKVGERRLEH